MKAIHVVLGTFASWLATAALLASAMILIDAPRMPEMTGFVRVRAHREIDGALSGRRQDLHMMRLRCQNGVCRDIGFVRGQSPTTRRN